MTHPAPCLGFRRGHRANGEPYLTAVVGETLTIEAGSTLDFRRLHAGDQDGPEFAMLVVPPPANWNPSKAQRTRIAADRLDGAGIRQDPRHDGEALP